MNFVSGRTFLKSGRAILLADEHNREADEHNQVRTETIRKALQFLARLFVFLV
ncbi:MAG TPA: hypothetical protein PKE69_04945 [Pyrinomonadaceae bacterium]|nr:hypothetical protein [Pyrinomonadaceae bacterium]